MGEGLGPTEKKKFIGRDERVGSRCRGLRANEGFGGGRDAGVSERVGGVTHRPRGALDGPDPVEDVIAVREGADARVRLRLRVGGKGERRGFNNRAENLKENARGGGGARKVRSARLGDAETRGFSPTTREKRRARAIRTMRDISSLCSLRRGEERKGMPSLSEWGKKPVATCVGGVVMRRLARVPSVDAHLLATDALSETPFPPPPAFPPPCGPAIAAVALVLMCAGASRPRALLQIPKPTRLPATGDARPRETRRRRVSRSLARE